MTAKFEMTEMQSLEDLIEHGIPLYVEDSILKKKIFKTRFPEIYDDIIANNRVWKNSSDMLKQLHDQNAVFGYQIELESLKRANCDFTYRTIDILGSRAAGFALSKNHPLTSDISAAILRYQANGFIADTMERYKGKRCPCTKAKGSLPRTDVRKMKGLLMVTVILAALSAIFIFFDKLPWCREGCIVKAMKRKCLSCDRNGVNMAAQ